MTHSILNTQIMKNLLIAFVGLLLIASCKRKDDPIAVDGVTIPLTATVAVNLTVKLTLTVTPENATDKSLTWTSSNNNIAAVADDGTVTGKSPGTVVITAASHSNPDKLARCAVTVIIPVASISVEPTVLSLAAGAPPRRLRVVVTPETASNKNVTYRSLDPSVASVSETGLVTALARGTTTVTVTSASDPAKTATCVVTVPGNDASVSAIAFGNEGFTVRVPAVGETITLTNAPRTIFSALAAVKVTLTAAAGASIKIGNEAFANGGTANFNGPVTFTVTAEDGVAARNYTATIPAYHADTNPYGVYTPAHLNNVKDGLR